MAKAIRDNIRSIKKRNYGDDMQKPTGVMDVIGRVADSDENENEIEEDEDRFD